MINPVRFLMSLPDELDSSEIDWEPLENQDDDEHTILFTIATLVFLRNLRK